MSEECYHFNRMAMTATRMVYTCNDCGKMGVRNRDLPQMVHWVSSDAAFQHVVFEFILEEADYNPLASPSSGFDDFIDGAGI